ncbi:outer membrane beta-barrel protein [Pyxidicoccus parkwayensis]|uniref:Outer membrane beta-barrel protein n=1 Tax=Pyxidicoccus parkwayensis TaxID=2813578 RepID=A0ABX7PAT6_9BACT|nr:outer membrane beta-barrel protein [Pyxidicoccus parkwaysis]QSQ27575.1 outer membrane beta-barrel protein [Pyxidicoccus parkwaysis]
MRAGIRMGLCFALLAGGSALADDLEARGSRYVEWRGPYFLLGLGAEGYTGKLAPSLNPGLSYEAIIGYRASEILGVEAGYSGGVNDLDPGSGSGVGGPDIIRNGAQAAINVGFIPHARLQPYALAGIGIERYSVRTGVSVRFFDDTGGYVPVGLGLRYKLNQSLSAEARATYSALFSQDFAPVTNEDVLDGRYQGLLQLGGTF